VRVRPHGLPHQPCGDESGLSRALDAQHGGGVGAGAAIGAALPGAASRGAHGRGTEAGLAKVASSLDRLLAESAKNPVKIALEVTAGQGTTLGRTFEELAYLLDTVKRTERLRICLDTAHLFAGGHDISTAAGSGIRSGS